MNKVVLKEIFPLQWGIRIVEAESVGAITFLKCKLQGKKSCPVALKPLVQEESPYPFNITGPL